MPKRPHNILFWVTLLVFVASLLCLVLSSRTGVHMIERHGPLTDAAIDLRAEATTAHLWLEEAFQGDPGVDIAGVWERLERCESLARAMLEGGAVDGRALHTLTQPDMREALTSFQEELRDYMQLARGRWRSYETSGIGSPADQEFDAAFNALIATISAAEARLRLGLNEDLRRYRFLQRGLLVAVLLLGGLVLLLNLRHERARLKLVRRIVESERRYRHLVETQPGIVYSFAPGPPPRIDYIGPQVEDLTGLAPSHFENSPEAWPELLYPEDREKTLAEHGRAVSRGESFRLEYRLELPDGRRPWLRDEARPIPGESESGPVYLGVISDISPEMEARESQRRSETILRETFQAIPDLMMALDRERNVVLTNGKPDEGGLSRRFAPRGCKCFQFFMDTEDYCEECPVSEVFETARPAHFEKELDGEDCVFEINAYPVFDAAGGVELVVEHVRDVTALRQHQEERLELERQVQHAQKLESLGVLAGGIAHDFNNILMTIIGNADLAMQDLPRHAPARESVLEIEKAARRAAGLAKQMLAYSGRGKFTTQPIDVNAFIEEMAHMLQIAISKKAVLKYNLADALPAVVADATQIRQVIMNLITNASEAIGERSGMISITTGIMDCDSLYLDASNPATGKAVEEPLEEGLYVYFEVADTGCGMDRETQERMFDPFFTTKFTGRGLGMSAALGILRGHRGTIRIYSEVGRGTSIKVLLPAARNGELAAAEAGEASGAAIQKRYEGTVLLAEDEESVRVLCKRMLERFGLQVIDAEDGRQAVETFRNRHEEVDLVLLDLMMPHLTGDEAFRELRRIDPTVRVILASGYNERDATQQFSGKGLAAFIQKPYRMERLGEVLAKLLGEGVGGGADSGVV